MAAERDKMVQALKRIVMPRLRQAGFNWFRYDDNAAIAFPKGVYAKIAESVLPYLGKAENWWSSSWASRSRL
jgi:hypothetical protein